MFVCLGEVIAVSRSRDVLRLQRRGLKCNLAAYLLRLYISPFVVSRRSQRKEVLSKLSAAPCPNTSIISSKSLTTTSTAARPRASKRPLVLTLAIEAHPYEVRAPDRSQAHVVPLQRRCAHAVGYRSSSVRSTVSKHIRHRLILPFARISQSLLDSSGHSPRSLADCRHLPSL